VDIAWRDGKLIEATIRSVLGNECRIMTDEGTAIMRGGNPIAMQQVDGATIFATETGKTYHMKAG